MKVAFLLWSPDISGGSYVIFEHALRLQRRGVEVAILTEEPVDPRRLAWHPDAATLEWTTYQLCSSRRFDLVLATWWRTVFELHRVDAERYGYFVQSIESKFYPEDQRALRLLVDGTYFLPLAYITEADWIQNELGQRFGQQARLARNGIRKDLYRPAGPAAAEKSSQRLRVLVEGPLGVPFKNVERTVELCKRSRADEVWLLTSTDVAEYPGVDRLFSRIPIQKTPEVYRSCDVLVKLSFVEGMFGPPLEMFHCGGTAVTYDVTGHDMYLADGVNSFVVKMGNEDQVVERINALKDDPALLQRLKAGAQAAADRWPDWEAASVEFETQLRVLQTRGEGTNRSDLAQRSRFLFDFYVVAEQNHPQRREWFLLRVAKKVWRRLRPRR